MLFLWKLISHYNWILGPGLVLTMSALIGCELDWPGEQTQWQPLIIRLGSGVRWDSVVY